MKEVKTMAEIGKKIAQRRKELDMTQEDLAKKMGYKSKSTINKIELGINDVVQSKVVQFAKVLNCSIAYLMDWEEDEKIATDKNLTDGEKLLLELFHKVPDDKKEMLLKMIEVAINNRG
jgi:transcriptional regulator with XRE-family HTH domain